MRIVQIVDNLVVGGAQKWIVTFAGALLNQTADSELAVVALSAVKSDALENELEQLGVEVQLFPFEKLLNPTQFFRLIRYLKQGNFDVIHTHLIRANIIGKMAGFLTGTPVVATLHSTGEAAHRYNPLRTKIETFVLRFLVKRIIAVGYSVVEFHAKRLGHKKTDIILNAVSSQSVNSERERIAVREELKIDRSRPLLISVGRISPPKGYHDLLLAVSELRKTNVDILLLIVGHGSLYGEISAQIITQDLMDHVILLGERNDVPRLLAAADLFVIASLREGLPLAVLEAMGAGLPIVATNVGDIPQVVSTKAGIIVPPHEPLELARGIQFFLDEPNKWASFGRAGMTYIKENHHPDIWLDKIMALYREVMNYG
jgi:glycosyltransferase involved in cell wall biosynthesis